MDPRIQRCLLDQAVEDEREGPDCHGHARVIYNAVDGWFFIGRSAFLAEPTYDCYPVEQPKGPLRGLLGERARRSLDELMEDSL